MLKHRKIQHFVDFAKNFKQEIIQKYTKNLLIKEKSINKEYLIESESFYLKKISKKSFNL